MRKTTILLVILSVVLLTASSMVGAHQTEKPLFPTVTITLDRVQLPEPANRAIKNAAVDPSLLNNRDDIPPYDNMASPMTEVGTLDWGDKSPSGTNNISFSGCIYGDILLVHDGWCAYGHWRHAGMWDSDFYYGSIYDACIWSARPSPGVFREEPYVYRNYDQCAILWVPNATYQQAYDATYFAWTHRGKPYSIFASKTNDNSHYCSKVVWRAWQQASGLDLDANGGYYVYPDDLWNSSLTALFRIAY